MRGNLIGSYWIGGAIGFLVGALVVFTIMGIDPCSTQLPSIHMGLKDLR